MGPKSIETIEDLMWESDVFEQLHAITILAKAPLKKEELLIQITNLQSIRADLPLMCSSRGRFLSRKKPTITLMDCARFLFTSNNYVERELTEVANIVNLPIDRLSSHFRGYLTVDNEYVKKLFEK